MKAILYILLGLSLGSGLTLIALQERFIRERRRLLAMGESQRAKAAQAAVAVLNDQWEQKCQQQAEELGKCQAKLTAVEASPPIDRDAFIECSEHDRLINEKNSEISRLAAEIKTIGSHLANNQVEVSDLLGQVTFLKGEIAKLEEEKRHIPDDDFLMLGQSGGHLLPGSVVRAFIKGHQDRH